MRIHLTSVLVDDQARARRFYTEVLGFVIKDDVALDLNSRWLTVVGPDGPAGVELVLEPMGFAAARAYQRALFEAGVPLTSFATDDLIAEVARLRGLGVVVRGEPATAGAASLVMFEDTCGNLIQLAQAE